MWLAGSPQDCIKRHSWIESVNISEEEEEEEKTHFHSVSALATLTKSSTRTKSYSHTLPISFRRSISSRSSPSKWVSDCLSVCAQSFFCFFSPSLEGGTNANVGRGGGSICLSARLSWWLRVFLYEMAFGHSLHPLLAGNDWTFRDEGGGLLLTFYLYTRFQHRCPYVGHITQSL